MRHGGIVRDVAVLSAIGIGPDERRRVLGVSVALSEAEVHWRAFLESLVARGMRGVEFIVSDDHDIDEMAEAISAILSMPLDERIRRNDALLQVIRDSDISIWMDNFLSSLRLLDRSALSVSFPDRSS